MYASSSALHAGASGARRGLLVNFNAAPPRIRTRSEIRGGAGEQKTMTYGAQALYLVLARNQETLLKQLQGFEYDPADELQDAQTRLEDIVKEQRNAFLSATMPELNALVKHLTVLLKQFFTVELPPVVGELAWEVVKEARLADSRA